MNLRVLSVLLVLSVPALPAGFTEPPIVFYGKVTNDFDGYTLPLSVGALSWTIQPTAGGTPLVITTPLQDIGGGYSYRLEVPVEKMPSGFTVSPATVAAPGASTSYRRDPITLDGTVVTISSPALPAGKIFTFAENQRGEIERVDLSLSAAFLDSDGDGLPDWWENLYGYDPSDPADGMIDDDGDTAGNGQEYADHTRPDLYEFDYPRWATLHVLTGPARPIDVDADGDGIPNGIEFGVDTDPHVPDAALAQSRFPISMQTVGAQSFLTMNVAKPAMRRTRTAYVVEGSYDLGGWSAQEGARVFTQLNDLNTLRVRLIGNAPTQGFLRLDRGRANASKTKAVISSEAKAGQWAERVGNA